MKDDMISRQAVIDFIIESDPEWCVNPIRPIFDYITSMPSVQPEQLTDSEKRIFLSAMGKEKRYCRKIDEEYKNSHKNSLVRICREIERKVKGALWNPEEEDDE